MNTPRSLAASFIGLALAGLACDKSAPAPASPTDAQDEATAGGAPEPSAAESAEPTLQHFAGWDGWIKINEARFKSKDHGLNWVDVYVPEEFVEVYKAGQTGPVGMRVVKAQYRDEEGTKFTKLTTMEKLAPGYDPENNDWYYGVYEQDGTTGKKGPGYCLRCHDKAAERDYLFGT